MKMTSNSKIVVSCFVTATPHTGSPPPCQLGDAKPHNILYTNQPQHYNWKLVLMLWLIGVHAL